MIKKFAKLYETERGQILVMRESGDDGPEIGIYFDVGIPDLAVTRLALSGFGDDEDLAIERADKAFDAIEEDGAKNVAFKSMDNILEMFEAHK